MRTTFEKLFLLVRFGTNAFYSGDLERAYRTFSEALDLFTKLENQKAIGIVNNNLGNIMMAMYRTMKKTGVRRICKFDKETVIKKGCQFFQDAIETGEKALDRTNDEEGFSHKYLVFMQQLSNRFFNRAMFLLTVREDHPDPDWAKRQGLMDLCTCKDMDQEVVDNGDHEGFKGDMDVYFELLMTRIKGLLALAKLGYDDEWGMETLFQAAHRELERALHVPGHALFRNMQPAGQMQRLDRTLVEFYSLEKYQDHRKAAKIAIRMLVEDDYLIAEPGMRALRAVIESLKDATAEELGGEDPSDVRSRLFFYHHMIGENLSPHLSKQEELQRENYRSCNRGDFLMEFF